MTANIQHEIYGQIVYEENVWTGKKTILVGGVLLPKVGKNAFMLCTPSGNIPVTVSGNVFKATQLTIGSETITLSPAPKWYEIVLSVLPFILIMIWGNSPALCSILPVIGGAIGGAISGMFLVISLVSMKSKKSVVAKIGVGLAMTVGCFLICALLGFLMVSALS